MQADHFRHVLLLHQVFQHERRIGAVVFSELSGLELLFGVGVTAPVRHQVALAHEVLGAQVATERTIGRHALLMGPLVEQEVALEAERLAAVGAHVRAIAGMGQHVFEQRFLGREHLGADDTIVLCPRRVLAHVTFQMFFACKGSITEFASVWRLACVNTNMTSKMFFARKRFRTKMTSVW